LVRLLFSNDLIKQAKFTSFCKLKAIVFPLFDLDNLIIFYLESRFWHLETVILPRRFESGNSEFSFTYFSPLTTKHYDQNTVTFTSIIDIFVRMDDCCHVTLTNRNWNFHTLYRCTVHVVTLVI